MARKELPIFTKTYDFLLWLQNHVDKFPKNERFRTAKRLEDSAFLFYELLMEAVYSKNTREFLLKSDFELKKIRFYLRNSHDRGWTKIKQYEYASIALMEIGKLLGGWLKSVS